MFQIKAAEKNIELIVDIEDSVPYAIILDPVRLRQILFNLIGNAVKFTDEGFVKLSAEAKISQTDKNKCEFCIKVEDTGIGLNEDQIENVFGEFVQASGLDFKYGGTGLGLTITKRLAEMMNGKVEVQSKIKKGSTFSVSLGDVEISSLIIEPDSAGIIKYDQINFCNSVVLIAEDNKYNLGLLSTILSEKNLSVLTAENGKEALSLLEQQLPDLIIMDIKMPVMDGYEAIKKIKSNNNINKIPIIALTADLMHDDKSKLEKLNINAVLPKPVEENKLFFELMKYLPHENTAVKMDENENVGRETKYIDLSLLSAEANLNVMQEISKLQTELEELGNSLILGKLKDIGLKVSDLHKQYNIEPFNFFGNKILNNTNNLNIFELKKTVKEFSELLKNIRNKHEHS